MSGYQDEAEEQSVGRSLEANVAFSVGHPLYKTLVDAMEKKVADLSAVRGAMRSSATVAFVAVALNTEESAMLAVEYPEFRLVSVASARPAHAYFSQLRRLAMHWCLLQTQRLASSAVVYGTPLVEALESHMESVSLVVDPVSSAAVHDRHSSTLQAYQLYTDHVAISREAGVRLSRSRYDQFLDPSVTSGKVSFRMATSSSSKGDALCVDGASYPYSPFNVAFYACLAGASVVHGYFMYHPVMLLNESGELPGTGIWFERDEHRVRFKYPEGVAGVTGYPTEAWRAWLTSHTFPVGCGAGRTWFQLELLQHRGPFMFYRMVRLPVEPTVKVVAHALELPGTEDMYVFTSWRMRSLGLDPQDRTSWVECKYIAAKRLVDRVYQFAMQLPREQFTRFAVRKQLRVVNDRVTVEGTAVRVNSALGEKMMDALTVDIHSRAFVDRYESGTLSDAARKFVDSYLQFPTLPFHMKVWYVVTLAAVFAWDWTLSPVNRYVRSALDAVRKFFGSTVRPTAPVVARLPSYVLVSALRSGLVMDGGADVAAELTRQSGLVAEGAASAAVKVLAAAQQQLVNVANSAYRVSEFALFTTPRAVGDAVDDTVQMLKALNPVDEAPYVRDFLDVAMVTREITTERVKDFTPVADPVYIFNEIHSAVLPGVAEQNLEYDTASISLDPQDRNLAAPYLRMPKYFGDAPKPKLLYQSRVKALNVPKRQQTLQELLSATAARNLNAPQVALPQDDVATARDVWANFLKVACVPDAKARLDAFKKDVVSLEEGAFREWVAQSTPAKLEAVRKELQDHSQALGDMPVNEYLVMLKADVKPTLSKKPLDARTEPQVIVYHEKAVSALYSSIFRVLVRRFLSILKPNFHVNLLKDTKDMEAFVRGVHVWDAPSLQYLENDFSKFDKSQGRFVHCLEELVYSELGMNEEFLRKWLGGHVECQLRAVSLGLSLHVLYQRKSGDATTAFGNVIVNALSVCYAYRGSRILWAVFMGDDSLVCATHVAHEEDAVAILAEVFNLGAKTYLTQHPYFASNFIVLDGINRLVHFVPDPVKRIERWSMAVSGDDPQWHERYVSAVDALGVYLNCAKTTLLEKMLCARYNVKRDAVAGVADAVATVLSDKVKFRAMWEELPSVSNY